MLEMMTSKVSLRMVSLCNSITVVGGDGADVGAAVGAEGGEVGAAVGNEGAGVGVAEGTLVLGSW